MIGHRELQLSKESGSHTAIVVESLADFIEAAGRQPRQLIIFRAGSPVSAAELRRYCLALGGIQEYEPAAEVRSVRYDPSISDSTAMSTNALALHTDGTFRVNPPERFMLSFTRADDEGGGHSTLMPLPDILASAPDWVIEALLTADFLFPKGYDGDLTDSYVGPVLFRHGSSLGIRWRSDDIWRPKVVQARETDAAGAVDWLHEFLATAEPLVYLAEAGEILLVPNTVMLHGRTALSAGSQREVLRVWVVGGNQAVSG